jgi:hypothetical protein
MCGKDVENEEFKKRLSESDFPFKQEKTRRLFFC